MNLRNQVIGINQLLSDMYQKQMRLSCLLVELNFDESDLKRLRNYFLADVVAIFLTTWDWVITSAETKIEQFGLIQEIYGLSFGLNLASHLNSRQIQIIKHRFWSSLEAADYKLQLESALRVKIRQLILAEENFGEKKRLSYSCNPANNFNSTYSLGISLSSEGKQCLTIGDRHQQICIPQAELSDFCQQLIDTIKFLHRQPQSHSYKEIRKTYRKAYTQWTREEEAILISNFERGASIKEIAQLLERQPGAIASRINKLDLRIQSSYPLLDD